MLRLRKLGCKPIGEAELQGLAVRFAGLTMWAGFGEAAKEKIKRLVIPSDDSYSSLLGKSSLRK